MPQETAPADEPAQSRAELDEETAVREAQALQLRKLRVSYDDIAKQLGYANRSGAFKAVKRAIAAITREPAEELLQLELEGLDAAEAALAGRILKGDEFAIDRMLKIKDMRAKLTGLYEQKTESNNLAEIKAALIGFRAGLEGVDLDGDDHSDTPAAEVDEPEADPVGT